MVSTSPNFGGNARWIAIESAVRAAGRIVVWQLAADDVSTAMMSSLNAIVPSADVPNTILPVAWSTSSELFERKSAPRTDWAANAHDDEDRDEDERREHAGEAGRRVRALALLVDARRRCPSPSR